MQKFQCLAAGLGLAALSFASAHAMEAYRFQGQARLAVPVTTEVKAEVAGVTWTCKDVTCTGVGPGYSGLDNVQKECGKLAAAIGPLAGFKSRGRVVVGRELAVCNRKADTPSVQVAAAQ